jgi:integrase
MARVRQPFFRPARNLWYVQLDGRQINLGPDKESAWATYYDLMSGRSRQTRVPALQETGTLVATVLDKYLAWLDKRVQAGNKSPCTYRWYATYLQSFLLFGTSDYRIQDLSISQLQPIHVYEWVDSKNSWKTGKRGAMIAVQRVFNWAGKAGLLKEIGGASPIKGLEKPPQGRRELLITQEQFDEAFSLIQGEEFRDLLAVAWDAGARPHELFAVQKSFVDFDNSRWVFPIKDSKDKKHQRVVYLTPKTLEITRRLCLKNPDGPIFRNCDGVPWTPYAVNCRFRKLRIAIGRKRLKEKGIYPPRIPKLTRNERNDVRLSHQRRQAVLERRANILEAALREGTKYNLYSIRHSWCTRALESGKLDAVTVSVLMGHQDTQMISRVYSHLTQRPDHLREAVKKATGG